MSKPRITLGLGPQLKSRINAGPDWESMVKRYSGNPLGQGVTTSRGMTFYVPRQAMELWSASERNTQRHAAEMRLDQRRRAAKQRLAEMSWDITQQRDTLYVDLRGEIQEDCEHRIIARLQRGGFRTVELSIDSNGGRLQPAERIIEALRQCKATVNTHAKGKCQSAALLLFLEGERRTVDPHCKMMMHNTVLADPIEHTAEVEQQMLDTDRRLAESMAKHCDISTDAVRTLMAQETFFDADAALTEGIATAVVDLERKRREVEQRLEQLECGEQIRIREQREREESAGRSEARLFGKVKNRITAQPRGWYRTTSGQMAFAGTRPGEPSSRDGSDPGWAEWLARQRAAFR